MSTIALQNGKVILKDGKASCTCCETPFGLLASATSAGGGRGCLMGPAVQTFFINPPYRLIRNKQYKLRINFSSGDEVYHKNSYYEANYTLDPDMNITWITTHENTTGNPWSISNGGKTIRYSLEDAKFPEECGGSNDEIQKGTAEAIIINTVSNIKMGFSFTGMAELQAVGFENIQFYLEDI